MFSEAELRLYSRHLALSELDLEGQEKLAKSKVMILGLGGLGSPVALYLAASGIGELTLVDHDEVSLSNLQRQILHDRNQIGASKTESAKKRINELNPHISIQLIGKKLDKETMQELVKGQDLVIDCSDNFQTRFALNQVSVENQTALISGAAIRWQGQVAIYNHSSKAACYQCLFEKTESQDDNCWEQGVLSPLVGVIGSLQAVEAIKYLTEMTDEYSHLIQYDAKTANFSKIKIQKDSNCSICSS